MSDVRDPTGNVAASAALPVGAGGGELLGDNLRDVVGPARRAGVDVGEGARHAVRGEAGVVADRTRVGVVAAAALQRTVKKNRLLPSQFSLSAL